MTYIDRTVERQYIRPEPVEPLTMDNGRLRQEIANAKVTPLKRVTVDDDQEFRSLVAHVLKRDETLGEFISRTGLGKATILAQKMSPIQIMEFVMNSEARNAAEGFKPPSVAERKPLPQHFVIDQ